jgi:hypothetical protein
VTGGSWWSLGVEGDKPRDTDLFRSDMHRSLVVVEVWLPSPSYRHAKASGRHQQLLYRFICLIAASYHYATSATHDDQRLANHATRPGLGFLRHFLVEEEGGGYIFHPPPPARREGAALPSQRLAGSRERSFRLGLGRVDGKNAQGNGVQLRENVSHAQKSTSASPSSDSSARRF